MTDPIITFADLLRPKYKTPRQRFFETVAQTIEKQTEALSGVIARTAVQRRRYAGDPHAYFHDILGWNLTLQQEDALEYIELYDRLLIPSGNNVGKTFLLAGYGCYRMDAVAALPDEERGLEEQGCQLLLPGPDHNTIYATLYSALLEHASRAEFRGFPMPGERSEKSILWRVRPRWHVEAFSPPKQVQREVAHTAAGRHHRNQIALVEEGQGVEERIWKSVEGMCSAAGNKIISSFNPTEPLGPTFQRARAGTYKVLHLSALEHPNIRQRKSIIPDAVDFHVIDARVKEQCRDRGSVKSVQPDREYLDFIYALPPKKATESGPREDGYPGHATGELRVYRPNATFMAQVLGRWPRGSEDCPFEAEAWDAAVRRHAERDLPAGEPDMVGVDAAREGRDETCTVARWGEDAEVLLRAYANARTEDEKALEAVLERRQWIGTPRIYPKGKGPETARRIVRLFPKSPLAIDESGVGTSVLDHAREVLRAEAFGVSFGAAAPAPTPGEPWSENQRTAMYIRAALMVTLGLVDIPDDPLLREECMAHKLIPKSRTVLDPLTGRKERKPTVLFIEKDEIKKLLGRSPDRSDAFVLAVNGPPASRVEILIGRA